MRRGFSIFLIAFFAFGPLSVFIDSEDANLPPCCRRHGAHHCAMAARMAAMMRNALPDKMPAAEAPMTCQQYPGLAALFTAPVPALLASVTIPVIPRTQAHVVLADYAAPESTPARIHAGRGPPQANLS